MLLWYWTIKKAESAQSDCRPCTSTVGKNLENFAGSDNCHGHHVDQARLWCCQVSKARLLIFLIPTEDLEYGVTLYKTKS